MTPGGESQVGWFRRNRKTRPDGELVAEHEEADARLANAVEQRDTEQRKLREEQHTLVVPMRRERQQNHFAELATSAFLRRGR